MSHIKASLDKLREATLVLEQSVSVQQPNAESVESLHQTLSQIQEQVELIKQRLVVDDKSPIRYIS